MFFVARITMFKADQEEEDILEEAKEVATFVGFGEAQEKDHTCAGK